MVAKYFPQEFEKKWFDEWEKNKIYQVPVIVDRKKKFYTLVEFPYPSGAGLHVGHGRSWTAMDAYSRKKRMQDTQVLYPMGWDAFGLPAENYAIKMGIHPSITVAENIARFKKQCQSLGLSFDWSREISTTDPAYYKWTQWIFIQLFKKGLAYRSEVAVNWCPFCKTNLADEEVETNGTHERCGKKTEKKMQKQWLLRITKYAQRLLDDLKTVDYSEQIKKQQVNWIGRKEGIIIKYQIPNTKYQIECFTTRPDTNFGATFIVIAPEHEFVKKILISKSQDPNKFQIPNSKLEEIKNYVEKAKSKSEMEREAEGRKKTGVFTGFYAVNNLNGRKMPIWISDFVLAGFGTGAVVGVPGHDLRDFEFAREFNLDIIRVVVGKDGDKSPIIKKEQVQEDDGTMINSDFLNGMKIQAAAKKIMDYFEEKGWGKRVVTYHLRDWIFSRQHYWGEPIPIIYCRKCWEIANKSEIRNPKLKEGVDYTIIDGKEYVIHHVLEKDLPVELPYVKKYEPTNTGESPLSVIPEFYKIKCPKCGGEAKRETDTMPNWAGSNWYYLAYLFADKLKTQISNVKSQNLGENNSSNIFEESQKQIKSWLPVDIYQGGFEHTTLHLLYSRFIYKFLYDVGVVPNSEPYAKRRSHGIVLGNDGRKMSKSFGNVINPDDIVKEYGADTLRIYEMFIGPFDQMVAWSDEAVAGVHRFLKRVWEMFQKYKDCHAELVSASENEIPKQVRDDNKSEKKELVTKLKKTIVKVTNDLDNLKFNTAVAALMEFLNEWERVLGVRGYGLDGENAKKFLQILAPFAPFITEEIWHNVFGEKESIHLSNWPDVKEEEIIEEEITIPVQINGKLKTTIKVKSQKSKAKSYIEELALKDEKVKKFMDGKKYKVIYVEGKILNFIL